MTVRKATFGDLEEILKIYEGARGFMRKNGNPTQWQGGYPYPEVVRADIESGVLHVIEEDGELYGVFAFIMTGDPDYANIDGAWLNDLPYAVIHRVASAGKKGGMLRVCIEYCLSKANNLKIDTHEDNIPMQNGLLRLGFARCGKVYLTRAGERIAYQLYKEQ